MCVQNRTHSHYRISTAIQSHSVCVKKIDRVSERGCVTERGADGGGGIVFFRI